MLVKMLKTDCASSSMPNFHLELIQIVLQGEWKPKQIDNPAYKGKWVHPEIDNPDYEADDKLYKYSDIGAIGFDLWQVCRIFLYIMGSIVFH